MALQVGARVFESSPRSMRQELWRSALQRHGGEGARAAQAYAASAANGPAPVPEDVASEIEKDLGRTFPNHRRFASPQGQKASGATGGIQGWKGTLFGMPYAAGSWQDKLVEAFGGTHDYGLIRKALKR